MTIYSTPEKSGLKPGEYQITTSFSYGLVVGGFIGSIPYPGKMTHSLNMYTLIVESELDQYFTHGQGD